MEADKYQKGKDTSVQLDEKLFELQALFDLSKALNSSLNLKSILDTILLTPMGRMLISKGMILITNSAQGYAVKTVKGLPKEVVGLVIQIDDLPNNPVFLEQLRPSMWRTFLESHGMELLIPIKYDEKNLGIIAFGKKIIGAGYSDSELDYLNSLSNMAATAVQNGLIYQDLKNLNRQLDKKIQELNTLFEIGKELNSTLDTNQIANLLAYSIMGEMTVNRCLIFIKDDGAMRMFVNKGYRSEVEVNIIEDEDFLMSLEKVVEPFLPDEEDDIPSAGRFAELGLAAVIPMQIQNETRGVIALGDKITKQSFGRDELDFLTTLGNLSMISIENAHLFEETLEKQRLEEELLIARDIQKQLLPDACPQLENYDISASNVPSRQVGGDYYDCIKISEHQFGLCIADVSGKGAPAAILMSNLQASLHVLVNTGIEIEEMTSKINDLIYRNTGFDKFITFFYGELDCKERTFTSVNAGHNPPYLFHKDGSFQLLSEGGLILGMMPNLKYQRERVILQPGDTIVMFTDGVSEAMNARDEEFEEGRIEQCIRDNLHLSADEMRSELLSAVSVFSQGQPQADDITVLIIKVN